MRLEELAFAGIVVGVSSLFLAVTPTEVPPSCPVTLPTQQFTPPAPYPEKAPDGRFWYGSAELWTFLDRDGIWRGLETEPGRRDKVFWWHRGYDGRSEPSPALSVSLTRLDRPEAPSFTISPATNAHHPDFGGWTMLTGIDIPSPGCWEITGSYRDATLSFVVWAGE